MRRLLGVILLMYMQTVTPEQGLKFSIEPYILGAPCSTKIDRRELKNKNGDCINPTISSKPDWRWVKHKRGRHE
jgi:hypothetical protein